MLYPLASCITNIKQNIYYESLVKWKDVELWSQAWTQISNLEFISFVGEPG